METTFENKCNILSELWLNYRDNKDFQDFVKYNDIALPLSFMISEGIVENPGELGASFVDETFELLLKAVGQEDLGFETLDSLLKAAEEE
jgi:hypothetical protein